MNVVQYSDYSQSVRFALTSRPERGSIVAIVLDLFRGSAPVSQTTLARVDRRDVYKVLLRCRRHLERQGLHAVAPAPLPHPAVFVDAPDPRASLPVAAFDWMFEAS